MARDRIIENSRRSVDRELEEVRIWLFESEVSGVLVGSRRSTNGSGTSRANFAVSSTQDEKTTKAIPGDGGLVLENIERVSEIKLPLSKLIKKIQAWQWSAKQQEAFEKLKLALTKAPVLARSDITREFTVQYNASNEAIGAVLSQGFEDGEHPIVYVHRVLSSGAERNYSTTEKCLALVWVIKKLRPYLEGYKFTAITDHSALRSLQNLKEATDRLAR